jgi:hypothetical protein
MTYNQLPLQSQLFDQLRGMKYFAKMDNLMGYYQLHLAENSQPLACMATLWGL